MAKLITRRLKIGDNDFRSPKRILTVKNVLFRYPLGMTWVFSLLIFTSVFAGFGFPYPTSPLGDSKEMQVNFVATFEAETEATSKVNLKKRNANVLTKLQKTAVTQGLTREQASTLRDLLVQHPITGDLGIKKYSQKNSTLGFCYGRATLAHMELLRRGVSPQNIRKIFVLGEMRYQKEIWTLHVATIVAKKGGGWWVLDGLFDQVYELKDWYKKMLTIAINTDDPVIRIYEADPVKFLPISGAYNEKDMYRPEYNGFFQDLTAWLAANPVKKEDAFFKNP